MNKINLVNILFRKKLLIGILGEIIDSKNYKEGEENICIFGQSKIGLNI